MDAKKEYGLETKIVEMDGIISIQDWNSITEHFDGKEWNYVGFNFHQGAKENIKLITTLHKILPKDIVYIRAWKGSIFFMFNNGEEKDFCGETTPEIIEWLVKRKFENEIFGSLVDRINKYPQEPESRIIDNDMRYIVLKEQKWKCNNCGVTLKFKKDSDWKGEIAHIDHIHPFAEWHSYNSNINERSNLQALCEKCNLKKGKKIS